MAKYKLVPGIPKWIQEDPTKSKKKLIKGNAYRFLENIVLTKGPLKSTMELLPEYITFLGDSDADFKNIKQS